MPALCWSARTPKLLPATIRSRNARSRSLQRPPRRSVPEHRSPSLLPSPAPWPPVQLQSRPPGARPGVSPSQASSQYSAPQTAQPAAARPVTVVTPAGESYCDRRTSGSSGDCASSAAANHRAPLCRLPQLRPRPLQLRSQSQCSNPHRKPRRPRQLRKPQLIRSHRAPRLLVNLVPSLALSLAPSPELPHRAASCLCPTRAPASSRRHPRRSPAAIVRPAPSSAVRISSSPRVPAHRSPRVPELPLQRSPASSAAPPAPHPWSWPRRRARRHRRPRLLLLLRLLQQRLLHPPPQPLRSQPTPHPRQLQRLQHRHAASSCRRPARVQSTLRPHRHLASPRAAAPSSSVHAPASPAPGPVVQAPVLHTRAVPVDPAARPAHVARCTPRAPSRAAQAAAPEVQAVPVHAPASPPAHVPASRRVLASAAHAPAVLAELHPTRPAHRQRVCVLRVPASAVAVSATRR